VLPTTEHARRSARLELTRFPGRLARPLGRLGVHRAGFAHALEALPHRPEKPRAVVDPHAVRAGIHTREWPRPGHRALVLDGEWDEVHVERPIIERTVEQLFVEGRPYTETVQFRHMVDILERGSGEWNYRCRTLADVHAYFERLIAAYESIRDRGYRTQEELDGRPGDEIRLYVARDGGLLIGNGGNHRYCMVRALGLRAVPVQIMGVHLRWARTCYDRWGGSLERAIRRGLDDLASEAER
jgi:hypothetical protein